MTRLTTDNPPRARRGMIVAALLLLMLFPTLVQAADLRILNWANYIAPETIGSFQAETGLEIVYREYDSLAELEAWLESPPAPLGDGAHDSGFDIVILPLMRAEQLIRAGDAALLQQAELPRFIALDPLLVQWLPPAPEGQFYAIPYLWGTSGLVWDREAQGAPVLGWQSLYDPQQASMRAGCGIGLADEPADLLAGALAFDKARAAEQFVGAAGERENITSATARLTTATAYSRGFFSSWEAARALAEGRLCLAQIRAPDLFHLIQSGAVPAERFIYTLPQEGAQFWMDVVVVAPGVDAVLAYQWLNFLLEAPIAAANAAAAGHGAVVVDAQEFLPASVADNPLLDPPALERARLVRFRVAHREAAAISTRLKAWLAAGRP